MNKYCEGQVRLFIFSRLIPTPPFRNLDGYCSFFLRIRSGE